MHFVDAKGILTASGGSVGMNIYRGCTHGCIYCDSRSKCYGFTHPFEDIEVKRNAPELLEAALKSKRKKCMIGTGAMSDPYMHFARGDREYYYAALDKHFPGLKQRYIREYVNSYELPSPDSKKLLALL